MKRIAKLLSILTAAVISITSVSMSVSAEDKSIELEGKQYVDKDANSHSISSDHYNGTTSEHKALGKVTVNGDFLFLAKKNDIDAYRVADDKDLTVKFIFDKSLVNEDDTQWHIADDGENEINGVKLEHDIDKGAVVLLTSLDHENWFLNTEYTDIIDSMDADTASIVFKTNNYALSNGCYYRIVAAYKLKKKNWGVWAISGWDNKKVTEVYEFYAEYQCADEKPDSKNEKKEFLGEVKNAGDDNGFSEDNAITIDDPHYGWEIGKFFISGFTEKQDNNVFYRNVGDKLTLWFKLSQNDLTKLNGDPDLYLAEDKNGYDQFFQTPKTNFKHGALIIRHTKEDGEESDPLIYTDYLAALSSPAADTKTQLFEEGKYEVALDYQVNKKGIVDDENDYRIFFEFTIKDGENMFFIKELDEEGNEKQNELKDGAKTKNGFKIDLANSKSVTIEYEKSTCENNNGEYTFNTTQKRYAKDGQSFTEEGIYKITSTNDTAPNITPTKKTLYIVKENRVLKAFYNQDKYESNYSVEQIVEKYNKHEITIDENGFIQYVVHEEPLESIEAESAVETNASISEPAETSSVVIDDTSSSVVSEPLVTAESSDNDIPWKYIAIGGGGGALLIIMIMILSKSKKSGEKKNEK